ncbi:hypothetical protein [Silvibacterium acidisoli]|uniref:hypothetical protein n=1 Tax=Acidobacteriaceae bacterium ZG23-2 TaxID=2883246 RepID=UPI00406C0206
MPSSSNSNAPVSPGSYRDDERWKLVEEILASRTFAKASRLSSFLTYICQETLEGRSDRVNEQQIGVHVFSRSPSYQAADDSIVRSQARLLRQKLDEYFEHERPNAPLRVSIPKGGYVPVFQRNLPVDTPAAMVEPPAAPPVAATLPVSIPTLVTPVSQPDEPAKKGRSVSSFAGWAVAVLLLAALVADLTLRRSPDTSSKGPAGAVWSRIFTPDREALIVSSDDALVLVQELTRSQVSLDDYLSGSYLEKLQASSGQSVVTKSNGPVPLSASWLNSHQYTSMADLSLAMRIARVPEAMPVHPETRYARDVRIDDLKSRNVILIGGIGANPWVSLFENQLNFMVNYDWKASRGYVQNKSPQKGEPASYEETGPDGVHHSYGVLAFLNGVGGTGDALLFEGSGMAGTESAADFLFNQEAFREFAQKIGGSPAHMPHFEVLLETASIGGNAPQERVIAYRVLN